METLRQWTDSGLIVTHSGTLDVSGVFGEIADVVMGTADFHNVAFVVSDMTRIRSVAIGAFGSILIGSMLKEALSGNARKRTRLPWAVVSVDGRIGALLRRFVDEAGGAVFDMKCFNCLEQATLWARNRLGRADFMPGDGRRICPTRGEPGAGLLVR